MRLSNGSEVMLNGLIRSEGVRSQFIGAMRYRCSRPQGFQPTALFRTLKRVSTPVTLGFKTSSAYELARRTLCTQTYVMPDGNKVEVFITATPPD